MLTVSSGHSAAYLTGPVSAGRESYYTGAVAAGEPPGRWYGTGAAMLGLVGLVETQDMTALYEHFVDPRDPGFKDPAQWEEAARLGHAGRRYATADEIYAGLVGAEPDASPERRQELRLEAERKVRKNVSFLDATFSVQKSVTVLHAAFEAQEVAARGAGEQEAAQAWGAHRKAVEDAIWAGNNAGLDYLAAHAGYSRIGHHGGQAGRFVDAHDWTIASFFQHDNRNHDPQLHIHNAILNRVRAADGAWRTLDGRAIYAHRGAAAVVAERTMEEHLTASLGVRFATRRDGKAREILGIEQKVLDLFSTRRRAITAKIAQLVEAFRQSTEREPKAIELDRLARQATFATRAAKSHDGETVEQRLARWDTALRAEVAGGLAQVARTVLDLAGERPADPAWSPTAVMETALAQVQATKSGWTRPDLARAVSDALPDHLGGLDGPQVAEVIDRLTAEAIDRGAVDLTTPGPGEGSLPAELRLQDGSSVYDRPGGRTYATADHLAAEQQLRAAAAGLGAPALTSSQVAAHLDRLRAAGLDLGADQKAAVAGILSSGARLETLVGPAGTGKSYVIGALAHAWTDPDLWNGQQRQVVGLATSQIAAQVLEGEGVPATNITRWLAAQQRLAAGRAHPADADWGLHAGDLVVVDESAMTSTADLTAIRTRAEAVGAKLLLCGDHRQLAAVGAAGGMELAAEAGTYELAEARRFDHDWEAAASLRLRERDPAVLVEYRKHGRIIDAGTIDEAETAAVQAYLADTLAGLRTVLVADTNETAGRVAANVRAELVRLGRVAEDGVPLPADGTIAGVGDIVAAHRNGWHLAAHAENPRGPINRERYRVEATRDDGGLVVTTLDTDRPERITLPVGYVAEHVGLGYASTAHAAQGMTVDTCHTLAGTATSPGALYVGMSRGRHSNTCYVTTLAVPDDTPPGVVPEVQRRDPVGVLQAGFDLENPAQAALTGAETRAAEMASMQTPAERFADVADQAVAGRTAAILDQLVADGSLTPERREQLAADKAMPTLARTMRQAEVAGHDPHQLLADALRGRTLSGSYSPAGVLRHRITAVTDLEPVGDSYHDWIPAAADPAWARHLYDLADTAETRRTDLGAQAAAEQPAWAVEALGPVPADPDDRRDWQRRAGTVAAHRELSGHDDATAALPAPPKRAQVEAYASWRAAWRALGRPESGRAETEMTDGQLRVRVRAYARERNWEPAYVAHELSGTAQAEHRQRQLARIRTAEAAAATDPAERQRLQNESAQAAAIADSLAARRDQLAEADRIRALWYAHTAATRSAADRAQIELAARGAADPDDQATTTDWLTDTPDEVEPQITDETDFADVADQRDADAAALSTPDDLATTGTAVDIRDDPANQPLPVPAEDWTRVPDRNETTAALDRARRALAELQRRQTTDRQHATDRAASWRPEAAEADHAPAFGT